MASSTVPWSWTSMLMRVKCRELNRVSTRLFASLVVKYTPYTRRSPSEVGTKSTSSSCSRAFRNPS